MVRPRYDWNLLDPDILGWSIELQPSAELAFSLIEARQVIEPAAARFAVGVLTHDERSVSSIRNKSIYSTNKE